MDFLKMNRMMNFIGLIALYISTVSLIGHSSESNLDPFGMELGAIRTSEANKKFPLNFMLNNSTDWFSMHEVDKSNLPPDDFFGRSDLISFSVRLDGIETIFSAHLIYDNYGITELLRDMSIRYSLDWSECTSGRGNGEKNWGCAVAGGAAIKRAMRK